MPNVYQPGLLQIRAMYSMDPNAANTPENITWWQSGSNTSPSVANLQAIQAIFNTNWANMWKPVGGADSLYVGSVITDWSSAVGVSIDSRGTFTAVSGSGGALSAPPQVAILISWKIALRWRGGHFRTYLPHIADGVVTGTYRDQIGASTATNLNTSFTALNNAMQTSGILGGQSFRLYKDKDKPGSAALFPVTNFGAQTQLATQRRRIRHVARR